MDRTDEDGLPASEVGIWTLDKHKLLRDYVIASHGARQKFQGRTSYIDPFCGPGRSWLREKLEFIDGSPLVAFEAGRAYPEDQFGDIHVGDTSQEYVDAAIKRIEARGGVATPYYGPAVETVGQITNRLAPFGLHVAFLDPFNLAHLPFSVIQELARFTHMDMIIHVSAMHLKRELPKWLAAPNVSCDLDQFAPGWREAIDPNRRQDVVREQIREHWRDQIRNLRMSPSEKVVAVENSRGGEIYWLVLVSRSDLADELWKDIAGRSMQGNLFP
jgi:three-Cys-motif partner protein